MKRDEFPSLSEGTSVCLSNNRIAISQVRLKLSAHIISRHFAVSNLSANYHIHLPCASPSPALPACNSQGSYQKVLLRRHDGHDTAGNHRLVTHTTGCELKDTSHVKVQVSFASCNNFWSYVQLQLEYKNVSGHWSYPSRRLSTLVSSEKGAIYKGDLKIVMWDAAKWCGWEFFTVNSKPYGFTKSHFRTTQCWICCLKNTSILIIH